MPKLFIRRFVLPVAFLPLLLACAGAPPQQQGAGAAPGMRSSTGVPQALVETKEVVVYLVPRSPDIIFGRKPVEGGIDVGAEFHDALKGVGFWNKNLDRNTDPGGYKKTDTESTDFATYDVANKYIVCTRGREFVIRAPQGPARWYAYHRFYVDVSVDERPDKYVVTLTPKIKEAKADRSLTQSIAAPKFPESEILDLLAHGVFRFKMEVDSEFGVESVLANFTRLLGASGPVRSVKKTDAKSFLLKGDGYEAKLVVELWPYRGGSKATVTAVVTTQPTSVEPGVSRTVDVRNVMEIVRREVEKVVKS